MAQLINQLNLEPEQEEGLVASGFIEVEEVELSAELGGRVIELPFGEGDEVQAAPPAVLNAFRARGGCRWPSGRPALSRKKCPACRR